MTTRLMMTMRLLVRTTQLPVAVAVVCVPDQRVWTCMVLLMATQSASSGSSAALSTHPRCFELQLQHAVPRCHPHAALPRGMRLLAAHGGSTEDWVAAHCCHLRHPGT